MSDDVPIVLTIAGTDPTGAAGINADLQVLRDFGCHGVSAITAVVWQNTEGIDGWRALPPVALESQLESVVRDLEIDAVKIGMLPTGDLIRETGEFLESIDESIPVILDPVMAGGQGERALMSSGGRRKLGVLADRVDLVTPNGPEADRMAAGIGEDATPEQIVEALVDRGWKRVLLKGGHLRGDEDDELVDWYGDGDEVTELEGLEPVEADVRGTGCHLSSAIAAGLARGDDWPDAVDEARSYLHQLLVDSTLEIGSGRPVVVRVERGG